jgi:hypothetical protein
MTRRDREDRLAAELAAAIEGCPPAEQLQAYHDGTISPEMRDTTATHVARCASCAAALEYLKSEAAEPPTADVPPDVERRSEEFVDAVRQAADPRQHRGWGDLLRVAAMIVFASALGLFAWQWLGTNGIDDDLGVYRGGEALDLLQPVGPLTELPAAMQWEVHPEAASYRVILLDESMNEVWIRRTETADGRLVLDAESIGALSPGSRYTWQVEGLDAVGAVIDRSAAAHFEIAGEPPR